MDRWNTFAVLPEGGIIESLSPVVQGVSYPGSLIDGRNFEPSPLGGYRRLKGYEKFDATEVPGTGRVIAVIAYRNQALALRNKEWHISGGSGWTSLGTITNDPIKMICTKYNWSGNDDVIITDGANAPIHYDGTDFTPMIEGNTVNGILINANTAANIFAAISVEEFHQHMYFSVGQFLRFSGPNEEGLVDGTGGSGEFITGSVKTGLVAWRENLFCLGVDRIGKVIGQNSNDFEYKNVTDKVGLVDPSTIQELNGDVYYLALDGVRTISGTVKNDDIELGSTTRQIPATMENLAFNRSGKTNNAVVVRDTSQYRLFVGDPLVDVTEGQGLLGGIRLDSQGTLNLEWFKITGINASSSSSNVFLNEEFILHGGFDGFVFRQEQGTSFNGANVDAFLRFPYWSMSDSEIRKVYYKAKIYFEADGTVNPILTYNFDYNIAGIIQPPAIPLGTGDTGFSLYGEAGSTYGGAIYGEDFPTNASVNLVGSGDNISMAISSNDTDNTYSIQSLLVEYGLASRR